MIHGQINKVGEDLNLVCLVSGSYGEYSLHLHTHMPSRCNFNSIIIVIRITGIFTVENNNIHLLVILKVLLVFFFLWKQSVDKIAMPYRCLRFHACSSIFCNSSNSQDYFQLLFCLVLLLLFAPSSAFILMRHGNGGSVVLSLLAHCVHPTSHQLMQTALKWELWRIVQCCSQTGFIVIFHYFLYLREIVRLGLYYMAAVNVT